MVLYFSVFVALIVVNLLVFLHMLFEFWPQLIHLDIGLVLKMISIHVVISAWFVYLILWYIFFLQGYRVHWFLHV